MSDFELYDKMKRVILGCTTIDHIKVAKVVVDRAIEKLSSRKNVSFGMEAASSLMSMLAMRSASISNEKSLESISTQINTERYSTTTE